MRRCSRRKAADTTNADLVAGDWVMRCEARTLDDIRALGGNRRRTSAVLRPPRASQRSISRSTGPSCSPGCSAMVTPQMAEWMRKMHPLRLQYELFSSAQSVDGPVEAAGRAGRARIASRRPGQSVPGVPGDRCRKQIVHALDGWRDRRRRSAKRCSSRSMAHRCCRPRSASIRRNRRASREMRTRHRELLETRIAELKSQDRQGRPARSGDPRAALCRHGARHGRRARLRSDAAASAATTAGARLTLPNSRRWCASNSSCCCSTRKRPGRDPEIAAGQMLTQRRAAFAAHARSAVGERGRSPARRPSGWSASPSCSVVESERNSARAPKVAPFERRRKAS